MTPRRRNPTGANNHALPLAEFRNPAQQADECLLSEDDGNNDEAFPLQCLPAIARNIVAAVSEKYQTPYSLAAVNALGVLSASIGSGLQIRTFYGEKTSANLYLVAIAPTATGKSRVSKDLCRAFERLEERDFEDWKRNIKIAAENEMAVTKKSVDRLHGKALKEANEAERAAINEQVIRQLQESERCRELLIQPKYICQDTTEPELARLMMDNKGRMFLHDGEARTVFSNVLGKHEKDGETGEAVLLKGFSGDALRTDRIGRDAVRVKRPCITLCVSVQPDKFQKLLSSETMHESGFIYRLLFCDTHARPQLINSEVDRGIPHEVQAEWEALIETLFTTCYKRLDEPLDVQCMPGALKLFEQFYNEHVENVNSGTSELPEGYALRSAEKAFRMALCLHAVEHPDSPCVYGLVEQTASNAITIVRWFDKRAALLLRERMQTRFEADMQRVLRLATKPRFPSGITANAVHQYTKWDTEKCVRVLEALVTSGQLLRRETTGGNGKVMRIYSPAGSQRGQIEAQTRPLRALDGECCTGARFKQDYELD